MTREQAVAAAREAGTEGAPTFVVCRQGQYFDTRGYAYYAVAHGWFERDSRARAGWHVTDGPFTGIMRQNPAYSGPMGIFEGYGEA